MSNTAYSTEKYESEFTYMGDDLGMSYAPDETHFRVWAPSAKQVQLCIYETGDVKDGRKPVKIITMDRSENGTWTAKAEGDWNGTYYTYRAEHEDGCKETQDPYAVSAGVNGLRSMILDLKATNPEGWDTDRNPNSEVGLVDAIIYEAHIRDYTVGNNSGIKNKGKYLGLAEENTHNAEGKPTGLAYMKELGITHLHLLPFFDFASVDESASTAEYNWGYDPLNFNVPEGSYATDAFHGEVRVKELKKMIQTLHKNGISVVMDVVYNHVHDADTFCVNCLEPGYFSRKDSNGNYSDGSRCGNDTASERSMVRKYIVDSVLYWTKEYHLDGFRFDLVGLIDTETINEIVTKVHSIRPDVIFYGEGWTLPTKLTKENVSLATQQNSWKTPGFAYFNDSIRDTIKGRFSDDMETGYATGARHQADAMKSNILGLPFWSSSPKSVVQYISCHDDLALFDKLKISCADKKRKAWISYNMLAAAMVFGSMGTVFFTEGEELLRAKTLEDGSSCSNSYNAGDKVNAIDWSCLNEKEISCVHDFYRTLISVRKSHPAFRMKEATDVRTSITFFDFFGKESIGYIIDATNMEEEPAKKIMVILNPEETPIEVPLTDEKWEILASPSKEAKKVAGSVKVDACSAMYLMVRK